MWGVARHAAAHRHVKWEPGREIFRWNWSNWGSDMGEGRGWLTEGTGGHGIEKAHQLQIEEIEWPKHTKYISAANRV